ncbi:lipoprotein peptidase LpqM (plasmid) [Mycobacterium branderi]|nr:lipoprotein peptidase LpqM [Mycobacterium branderi]
MVVGRALSPLYDPFEVGGLPAQDGPSGVRDNAPQPTGDVRNTDHGDNDKLAVLAVNDVAEFWKQYYSDSLKGSFSPVANLLSYDSRVKTGKKVCGEDTYKEPNAFYCPPEDLMAWDRGVFVPIARRYFGDITVAGLIGHEYGHAVQHMAKLVGKKTPGIVFEEQADCFGGVYLRWVAEGQSPRFIVSTGDGLDHVLAGVISSRDPVITPKYKALIKQGHGTALDRVSAFQVGFVNGATACAGIDMDEIKQRRGDLPLALQPDPEGFLQTGEVPINEETLSTLLEVLNKIFSPAKPPTLSLKAADCPDAHGGSPAAYCPATNTITADLPALQKLGKPANESDYVLVQGDDTALSVVMSRYVLALEHERGVPLDSATAALRTACLTGVAHRKMADKVELPSGKSFVLTAGDLDEAVAGLLTNRLVASDVNGATVPAGFTRITAFRSGVTGDEQLCYARFRDDTG